MNEFSVWIARNKNKDCSLFVGWPPVLDEYGIWWNGNEKDPNFGTSLDHLLFPKDLLDELSKVTFENSPQEVNLLLK